MGSMIEEIKSMLKSELAYIDQGEHHRNQIVIHIEEMIDAKLALMLEELANRMKTK